MAKLVTISGVSAINADALDAALKAISPKCRGIVFDNALRLVLDDDTDNPTQAALIAAAQAHNPATLTPEQAAVQQGKADSENFKPQIDQAIANITTGKSTLQATPNIANAIALLNIIADVNIGILKALRYILRRL